MSKKIKSKSHGIQRSDIPYKDRLMVNQFANIAQHRDHSAVVANKIGMVALNDLKGMGYIQLTRWGKLYHCLNEEFYQDPEYQEAKLDERIRKMGFVVENGRVIVAEDENGEIVPTSTLVLCPEILFVREQLSPADQFAQVAEAEARERAEAMAKQLAASSDEDGVRFFLLFEQLTDKVDAMRELAATMQEKGKTDQASKFMGALRGALADVLADLEGGAA